MCCFQSKTDLLCINFRGTFSGDFFRDSKTLVGVQVVDSRHNVTHTWPLNKVSRLWVQIKSHSSHL